MLKNAPVSVIVTQDRLLESAQQLAVRRQPMNLCLDGDWHAIKEQRGDNLPNKASSTNLAYVIYTSGSTGIPKGVQINHRSVANLLCGKQPLCQFNESDVWTGFHSYAFDFSVWEIWGCLLSGGRLVIVPLELMRSPEASADLIRGEKVTVLNQTPAFDQDENAREQQMPAGLFRSTCYIPANLLNAGLHRVKLHMHRDTTKIIFRDEEALIFEVLAMGTRTGAWFSKEPGTVRPILDWKTDLIENLDTPVSSTISDPTSM